MSFAYKPLPFDDLTAFNRVGLTPNSIKFSCTEIALQLANVLPRGLSFSMDTQQQDFNN